MKKTARKGADTFARVNNYIKIVERRDQSLKECIHWINFTDKLTEDIARHQGQTPPSSSQYPLELSQSRKLGKEQLPEGDERLERFITYVKLMTFVNKLHQAELDRLNDMIRIMVESNKQETAPALPEEGARDRSFEESIARKFFTGYVEFGEKYGIELPGLNEAPKPEVQQKASKEDDECDEKC